jgi:cephalosporin-C deacetylase-like acetyl esterase
MKTRKHWIRAALAIACPMWLMALQSDDPRQQLFRYIDGIARVRLEARKQEIAQIRTRAAAETRRTAVREKVLRLIGGLPERMGRVQVKTFGTYSGDGFRVENIAYESLPGFWVTANLYLPSAGKGPYPAIVAAPGHGAAGKIENWSWGVNFARNGIVTLAYDPIGQGERLQYYDSDKKSSFIGNPTGEHGEANIGPMLIGEDIAQYMVNDAMRGVDYLSSRKDVDSSHIGAFGCSGGGTMTAYFAALDDRVKATATACYITSFEELLASPQGAQDAEQSIPHFIEQGLDFADWVEAFAPKPYAVVSTKDDMFPFEGARQTVDEAKRFYGLYDAGENLAWITGPGGHGNLGPISPAIMAFFTKSLKGTTAEPTFTPMRLERREILQVTPTGQVANSIGGETVYSINRKRAEKLIASQPIPKGRLLQDIRSLTGAVVQPGKTEPVITTVSTAQHDGYHIDTISMKSDGDTKVAGQVAIPESKKPMPAILVFGSVPSSDVARLARAGRIVAALEARPNPPGTESIKSPYLGIFNLLSLRTFLVGRTIIGLRIDDVIRAMDWLSSRKDVDRSAITAYGEGASGMVVLHAAVLDERIRRVVIENTLVSYRTIVDQPVHRDVSPIMIPGVLRHYDTRDLIAAVRPRSVSIYSPVDALGNPIASGEYLSRAPGSSLPVD